MTVQCKQCGAELLPEMRFCRRCGHATGILSVTEEPTRPLGTGPAAGVPDGMTSPYAPPATYAGDAPPAVRRKRIWPWFLGGFLALAVGTATAVGFFLSGIRDRIPTSIQVTDEGARITTSKGDEIIIPSHTETAGDMRTVKAERFPLNEGDALSLHSISGGITISTWNESDAEVKLIKHGIDVGDHPAVNLIVSRSDNQVSIKTEGPGGTPATVDYELKIPRGVSLSSIESVSGAIHISGADWGVTAKSASGEIQIDDQNGPVSAKSISGSVSVTLAKLVRERVDLGSMSGDLELKMGKGSDADLQAESVSGSIEIDPAFLQTIDNRPAGHIARGKVGNGGAPVKMKTVSGNIKVAPK